MKTHYEAYWGCAVLGLIFLMIIPLPAYFLDVFLTLSLSFSVMTLIITLSVRSALEFSAFPSLLLFLTLFRLGLNIASVRLILIEGDAGSIIPTFGKYATGDSPVIGFILFLLITAINFIVITKGAGRISEVAARFMLEAMPGKQIAIDGGVNGRILTPEESRRAREKIEREGQFYGAMDGASKFVRGEAIAAVLITSVNILGAIFVGFLNIKNGASKTISFYLQLAIGDGLVNQIPSLLISLSTGLMVTRVSHDSIAKILSEQILNHPKALFISGLFLFLLALFPHMPIFILFFIGSVLLLISIHLIKKKNVSEEDLGTSIEIWLGSNKYTCKKEVENLIETLKGEINEHLGLFFIKISLHFDASLSEKEYQIKIKKSIKFQGVNHSDTFLQKTKEIITQNAHLLINRQDVIEMLQKTRFFNAAVVDELISKKVGTGTIVKVMQNLLKEGISIYDFGSIFETLADNTTEGLLSDVDFLTEMVRLSLAKQFMRKYLVKGDYLYAITLDPAVEEMVASAVSASPYGKNLLLRPKTIENIESCLSEFLKQAHIQGIEPVVLTSVKSRMPLCRLLDKYLPHLPILSYKEIGEIKVHSLGTISDETLIT